MGVRVATSEAIVVRTAEDVLDVVNSGRLRPRRALLVKIVALGSIFVDGWDLGSFGLGTVQVSQEFHLDQSNWGFHSLPFLSAAILIGALVGGLLGGYLTDRIGRLRMFLIDLLLLVGATVLCATAPNPELLWLWRFLMGVGIGLDVPVALAFIAEYSAVSSKGRNVNLAQVWSTGASAVVFFSVIPFHELGVGTSLWRYAIGLGAVPTLAVLILRFIYSAESPMWAAKHESVASAVEILRRNYHMDVELRHEPEEPDEPEPGQSGESPGAGAREKRVRTGSLAELFRRPYAIRTLVTTILVVIQAIEFYAISLYTPKILTALFGDDIVLVLVLSGIANLIGALGAFACVGATQRLGLRRLVLVGCSITAGCLAVISGSYELLAAPVAVVLIMVFYAAHNFGPGYAGTAMGTLSYPTNIRGISGGYAQAMTRVGGMLGAYAFPVLLSAIGMRFTIGVIVLAPLAGIVAVLLIRWEPVGRDVEVHDDGEGEATARTTDVTEAEAEAEAV